MYIHTSSIHITFFIGPAKLFIFTEQFYIMKSWTSHDRRAFSNHIPESRRVPLHTPRRRWAEKGSENKENFMRATIRCLVELVGASGGGSTNLGLMIKTRPTDKKPTSWIQVATPFWPNIQHTHYLLYRASQTVHFHGTVLYHEVMDFARSESIQQSHSWIEESALAHPHPNQVLLWPEACIYSWSTIFWQNCLLYLWDPELKFLPGLRSAKFRRPLDCLFKFQLAVNTRDCSLALPQTETCKVWHCMFDLLRHWMHEMTVGV